MKYTLVLPSQFFSTTDDPVKQLEHALSYDCFDRCELTVLSGSGNNFLRGSEVLSQNFKQCVDLIKSKGLELVLAISVHQNDLNRNINIATYQSTRTGKELIITRICPSNKVRLKHISTLMAKVSKDLSLSMNDGFTFSYFRFENFGQCVCESCIDKFKRFLGKRGKYFNYHKFDDLLDEKIIESWVKWRRLAVNDAAKYLTKAAKVHSIIEIDFDETKRYMTGVLIEEGIDYASMIKYASEVYLHIEPCRINTGFLKELRAHQTSGYINHLKYMKAKAMNQRCEYTFLYWALSTTDQINANLLNYLELADLVGPKGVALLTPKPVELARKLSSHIGKYR